MPHPPENMIFLVIASRTGQGIPCQPGPDVRMMRCLPPPSCCATLPECSEEPGSFDTVCRKRGHLPCRITKTYAQSNARAIFFKIGFPSCSIIITYGSGCNRYPTTGLLADRQLDLRQHPESASWRPLRMASDPGGPVRIARWELAFRTNIPGSACNRGRAGILPAPGFRPPRP